MVEEKEGKYIIVLLDCDTHNWVTDRVQLMGEERNKEIRHEVIKKED